MPLKYAGLYKVIMNCSTVLGGLLYFRKEMTRGGGVRGARDRASGSSSLYYVYISVCAALRADAGQTTSLVCIRPGEGAPPTITAREGKSRTDSLLCVTLASVPVVRIASNWLLMLLMLSNFARTARAWR